MRLRDRALLILVPLVVALAAPAAASALEEGDPDPIDEFLLHPYIEIKPFSWLDLSINKAVVYLFLAAAVSVIGTVLIVRGGLRLKPSRIQMFAEVIYDFTETSIARASLPQKVFPTWFPYLAALFVFIWVSNLISYIPMPFDTENKVFGGSIPGFSLYAATSNLSVTLALTLVTIVASHYVGIQQNGARTYFKHWVPPTDSPVLKAFLIPLEILSQLLRIVSLSVRLFANMLAGHLLVLMSVFLIVIIGSAWVAFATVPVGVFFYLFEVLLVANLQAFIFAMLSGIYIGFAVEPPH
jgi:F-type H+-transporting ATPase subunit a